MKKLLLVLLPFGWSASSQAQDAKSLNATKIEGQVFVVTKGGQNYKLGDVEVTAYPLDAVRDLIKTRKHDSIILHDELEPVVKATANLYEKASANADVARDAAYGRNDYSSDNPTRKVADDLGNR